jgi:aminomethyltransferase
MRRTPLHGEHLALGGKVVDFHGWALPVQFEGILQEHAHTRTQAALFDCSHMGEFTVRGAAAIERYEKLLITDVKAIKVGRGKYGAFLNDDGGIIDDVITIKLAEDDLYIVTNAGPLEEISPLITNGNPGAKDVSNETAKIDIQGPLSRDILIQAGVADAAKLKYYEAMRSSWKGTPIVLSRTGYTGELGFELFMPNEISVDMWRDLIGRAPVKPAGLGARDTLRTEIGMGLSGQDFDASRTPLEARMASFIAWNKDFRGKAALARKRDAGGLPILTGIRTFDRRSPRHEFEVKHNGAVVGVVSSGTFGPSMGYGIGLAYVPQNLATPGTKLTAGPKDLEIETVELPFYKDGTCRR